MDAHLDGAYTTGEDEVTAQRLKHRTRFLKRPGPGFPGMAPGQAVASVGATTEEAKGAPDAPRSLRNDDQLRQTIESVVSHEGLEAPRSEAGRGDQEGGHD